MTRPPTVPAGPVGRSAHRRDRRACSGAPCPRPRPTSSTPSEWFIATSVSFAAPPDPDAVGRLDRGIVCPRGGRAGSVGAPAVSRVRLRTEPGSPRCSATLAGSVPDGEPRLDVREREAAVGLVGPRHRRPRPVAPRFDRPAAQTDRIPESIVRHGHVGHPDLVAVVEDRRPAERQEHHERGADLPVLAVAPPGREPRRVVVRSGPRGPRRPPGSPPPPARRSQRISSPSSAKTNGTFNARCSSSVPSP